MATEYSAIKALNIDLKMRFAEEAAFVIPLFDPDDSNNPYDLSGFTSFTMNVKHWPVRADNHFQLTSGDSEISVGGANNNEITLTVSKASASIKPGEFYYQVITNTNAILLEGKLIIEIDDN